MRKTKYWGYLVTIDIEKAFDSLDHDFLVTVLNKFGFEINVLSWIKLLLNTQQSCVIYGGNTTPAFNLKKFACQGGPVLAYLFILALEFLIVFIKSNENIKGIEIFKHVSLYTAYADDSTFFLRDSPSVKELINSFNQFYHFLGLKGSIKKCETLRSDTASQIMPFSREYSLCHYGGKLKTAIEQETGEKIDRER